MSNQSQNQTSQEEKNINELLGGSEEAYEEKDFSDVRSTPRNKKKAFDWKTFVKKASQIGLIVIVGIGAVGFIYDVVEYNAYNDGGSGVIESLDEIPTGDGIISSELSYDYLLNGDYYVMPCPLQTFLDNGWTIDDNSDVKESDTVKKIGTFFTLENNGSEIWVEVESPTGKKIKVKDSYVTYISMDEDELESFEMSGGIAFGMNDDEVDAIAKENNWEYHHNISNDYSYYSIYYENEEEPYTVTYSLDLSNHPGGNRVVDGISISCYENYYYFNE